MHREKVIPINHYFWSTEVSGRVPDVSAAEVQRCGRHRRLTQPVQSGFKCFHSSPSGALCERLHALVHYVSIMFYLCRRLKNLCKCKYSLTFSLLQLSVFLHHLFLFSLALVLGHCAPVWFISLDIQPKVGWGGLLAITVHNLPESMSVRMYWAPKDKFRTEICWQGGNSELGEQSRQWVGYLFMYTNCNVAPTGFHSYKRSWTTLRMTLATAFPQVDAEQVSTAQSRR